MTDLVLVDKLGIRLGLYGGIDAAETVNEDQDVSLRIDEAQDNSVIFENMGVSMLAWVRGAEQHQSITHFTRVSDGTWKE